MNRRGRRREALFQKFPSSSKSQGEKAVIEYLSQWHYTGEHMTCSFPAGTTDRIFRQGIYILIYNDLIGYIGLIAQIETEH